MAVLPICRSRPAPMLTYLFVIKGHRPLTHHINSITIRDVSPWPCLGLTSMTLDLVIWPCGEPKGHNIGPRKRARRSDASTRYHSHLHWRTLHGPMLLFDVLHVFRCLSVWEVLWMYWSGFHPMVSSRHYDLSLGRDTAGLVTLSTSLD